MKTNFRHGVLLTATLSLLTTGFCEAGDVLGLFGQRSDCGCGHTASQPVHVVPMNHYETAYPMASMLENGCACSAAASACCGMGGGVMQIGSLYSAGSFNSGSSVSGGGSQWGGPAPGSFLSGYEGLPNMDGGGVHHRYPYHSYRRPWAHPGTPSTNVTIVW